MNDATQRRLMILSAAVVVPLLFLAMPLTRPVMFATFAVFSHIVLWIFDCAFGAEAFGIPPFVMWAFIGGIIGATLGYWNVAPAVGRRRMRRVAGAIPLTLVTCLLVGDALVSIATSPKPSSLRPPVLDVLQHIVPPPQTAAKAPEDPNNEPAPGLYSTPKEDVLSTEAEGGTDVNDKEEKMSPPIVPGEAHPNSIEDLAGKSVGADHATVDPSPSAQH